jgi:chromosome segregation ATPase
MAAAEHISAQLEADPDNAQLNEALNQLVTALEDMQDDIELEVEEADDAKEMMDELEATVKMYADKLKSARTDMRRAANAMEKAKLKEERANQKADRAAVNAGLKDSVGGLSSALESMNRQAAEATASADAAIRKAELLGDSKVEENDAVAAAMAAVSGEAPKPTSARDRLAALKG